MIFITNSTYFAKNGMLFPLTHKTWKLTGMPVRNLTDIMAIS